MQLHQIEDSAAKAVLVGTKYLSKHNLIICLHLGLQIP